MSSPAVPSIPPLSSITDPNTRAVLQAMVDGQRIRNGDIGDGDEKFLTVADLKGGVNGANWGGSSGAIRSASGGEKSVAAIIQALSDKIMQSRIWKLLDEQITRIDTPEWFNSKFASSITVEQNLRSDSDGELAQQITTVFTNLNGSLAGVQEELTAQSTETTALATRVTTLGTDVNGNIGLIQDKLDSTSDLAGATANATTQLQTKVGQVDAAAQQALSLSASVDGKVKGTWSVKFDLNGYVAGVALGVDQQGGSPPKSNFVVRADTFAVGSPGSQDTVPFFVTGGVTYIKTAMIQDASVDTLKIAGNAVTVPSFGQQSGDSPGNGGWQRIASVTVSNAGNNTPMAVVVTASGLIGYASGLRTVYFSVSHLGVGTMRLAGPITADYVTTPLLSGYSEIPANGVGTFVFDWWGADSTVNFNQGIIVALGAKR